MSRRHCFLLRVRPDRLGEYRRRHREVWPEMLAAMARTDVNARWQAEMAPFFVGLEGGGPDEGLVLLEEVFHLEDQLPAKAPRFR
jgi:L-rhamnose mutarotase